MRLNLDTRASLAKLLAVGDRAQRAAEPLHAIGERMVEFSIPENFRAGGRPRWAASARGGQVGVDTGELSRSVSHEVSQPAAINLRVGTNLRYAAQFHHGGEIRAKKARALAIPLTPAMRHRRPKDVPDLFLLPAAKGAPAEQKGILARPDGKTGVEPLFVLRTKVRQPARPFLVWQAADLDFARRTLSRFFAEAR